MNSRLLGASIIVPILMISVGMFIYNSASSTITDSVSTLSTQEIDAFNNQYISYEGKQSGANIRALMGRLIANSDAFRGESSKVPQVYIDQISTENPDYMNVTYTEFNDGDNSEYINDLSEIRNQVERKHIYYVEMTYQPSGLIDYIQISYDTENPILEYCHR